MNILDIYLFQNGKVVEKIKCSFDDLMKESDGISENAFIQAVKTLESIIKQKWNYQISLITTDYVKKYLKKYAAFGYVKEPLIINVTKLSEDNLMKIDIGQTAFEEIIAFPNSSYKDRYDRLVGLEELKGLIQKEGATIMAPEMLKNWSIKNYGKLISALESFQDRYPFFIFEGDVGTGKTEFAMTFGSSLAKFMKSEILLARMSMKSRGNGVVGEMSKLISKVFQDAKKIASDLKKPIILLLDEADSLAQSREESQMHHEDRAGVNALIQGIDHIRNSRVPILVVFCTNRLNALDPAIKRRAALIHTFTRPNFEQRLQVFKKYYEESSLKEPDFNTLAKMTGEDGSRNYGFTYSDILTRIIPQSVLEAYPDKPLTLKGIEQVIMKTKPTSPFTVNNGKEENV